MMLDSEIVVFFCALFALPDVFATHYIIHQFIICQLLDSAQGKAHLSVLQTA